MTLPNDVQNKTQEGNDVESKQYLTFFLGKEEYGIDILKVQEIRGWESTTKIPNAPDYMLGVINLRGEAIPIIDLRTRFSLQSAEFNTATVIIVVKIQQSDIERTVGLVVDAISDVYNIKLTDMLDAPGFNSAINTEYLEELTTVNDKMVIILDVDKLVNSGFIKPEQDTPEQVMHNVDSMEAQSTHV